MYAGSIAYGTQIPSSDVDFRGIFVAPRASICTPYDKIEEYTDTSEQDSTYFELCKFMQLCVQCNPNIIELLWTSPDDVVFSTPEYELLRQHAPALLTRRIATTTTGYAKAQLAKLTQSKKKVSYLPELRALIDVLYKAVEEGIIDGGFIQRECGPQVYDFLLQSHPTLNVSRAGCFERTTIRKLCNRFGVQVSIMDRIPVIIKPQQKNYMTLVQWFGDEKVLSNTFDMSIIETDHRLLPYGNHIYGVYQRPGYDTYDSYGNLNTTWEKSQKDWRPTDSPLCIVKFNFDEYDRVKDTYSKFWEWRSNRNPARLAMEEEHDFDLKHAMHLIRLYTMGVEAVTLGKIIVKRPDYEYLLDIRKGVYSFADIMDKAADLESQIEYGLKHTSLPTEPNIELAKELILAIQSSSWKT
jgi:predicted nucleotidyltransferase